MAENLLWPVKLKKPPSLIMDPAAMFGSDPISSLDFPMINMVTNYGMEVIPGTVNYGAFDLRILSQYSQTGEIRLRMSIPIQQAQVDIAEYRCHGWFEKGADITSNPDRTESSATLNAYPDATLERADTGEHGSLLQMRGNSLENNGDKPVFMSSGTYSILRVDADGTVFKEFTNQFGTIFRDFINGTIAIELVIRIRTPIDAAEDGFSTEIAPI